MTAFVKASTRRWAIHRIATVIAALEDGGTAESVSHRIYNCTSAAECVEEGLSEDLEARIFETGWGGGKPICFVQHPLFLVADPAPQPSEPRRLTATPRQPESYSATGRRDRPAD